MINLQGKITFFHSNINQFNSDHSCYYCLPVSLLICRINAEYDLSIIRCDRIFGSIEKCVIFSLPSNGWGRNTFHWW